MNEPTIRKYIQDQGINESIADTDDINLSALIWLNSKDLAYMNPKELKILYESLIKGFVNTLYRLPLKYVLTS